MPDVDFWDDPPEQRAHPPPSDGAPRVVLAPVDDSDHAARAVAWACQHLLRGGPDGDTLHLLHVVPAVHASTAMAYGGPMVMLEDLSIFAQSIYAVTTLPAKPATHAPIRPQKTLLFFGFCGAAAKNELGKNTCLLDESSSFFSLYSFKCFSVLPAGRCSPFR